jgi:uncharacterized protein (DUF58 family)
MIVPQTRLIFWTAVAVTPFAAVGVAMPAAAPLSFAVIGIFVILVLVDAYRGLSALDGLTVETGGVTRLSKDREGLLELRLIRQAEAVGQAYRVRLGLAWPQEFQARFSELDVELPANASKSRVNWECTGRKRGRYVLERCYLAAPSPVGFWEMHGSTPLNAELRVYPDLLPEREQLAALFLRRATIGVHTQRQLGKGREFEKLREYAPGDNYEDIHWKATAKRGHPVTKIFQIERTQEIYVVVDASRLSARESQGQTVLERFVTSALILGVAAERQGDLFGMLTFSDRVHGFIRARNGKQHHVTCRDALYTLQPRPVTPDFDEVCSFLRLRLRKRALLVWLTSLDDPVLAESFAKNAPLIARHHLVLVNMPQPAGSRPLFADSTVATTDDIYRALSGHMMWHRLRCNIMGWGSSSWRMKRCAPSLSPNT